MSTSDDEDALLSSLEAATESDPTLTHLRAARLQQLASSLKHRAEQRAQGHGTYAALPDEAALLALTTAGDAKTACVVHFFQPGFARCRIMDGHLAALAAAHLRARFVKMDVGRAPFLVERLGVRVLPCVIAFVGGVGRVRIVGFEGLGDGGDGFATGDLERRLVGAGVLGEVKEGERGGGVEGEGEGREEGRGGGGRDGDDGGDDDDDEWD